MAESELEKKLVAANAELIMLRADLKRALKLLRRGNELLWFQAEYFDDVDVFLQSREAD
jgi:hypothetical protein